MSGGFYVLNLNDQLTAVTTFEGGDIEGEIETLDRGPQQLALKHISTLRYQPFTIEVGMSMGAVLAGWLKASLDLAPERKDGVVVTTNRDGRAQSYCHFKNTLVEELTIPAMDAASKDAAFFKVRFQPEEIVYAPGDEAIVRAPVDAGAKRWLCSNFRLRIGDLPCARVSKIDSFTIRQRIVESTVGQLRPGTTKEPVNIEFPNLRVTLAASDVGPWQEWFSAFVIRGENDQGHELQGALDFLDPTLKETLASIEFSQVGIFSLKAAAGDPLTHRVAELYVEKMAINLRKM